MEGGDDDVEADEEVEGQADRFFTVIGDEGEGVADRAGDEVGDDEVREEDDDVGEFFGHVVFGDPVDGDEEDDNKNSVMPEVLIHLYNF